MALVSTSCLVKISAIRVVLWSEPFGIPGTSVPAFRAIFLSQSRSFGTGTTRMAAPIGAKGQAIVPLEASSRYY